LYNLIFCEALMGMKSNIIGKFYTSMLFPRIQRFVPGLEKAILFYRHPETLHFLAIYADANQIYETDALPDQTNKDYLFQARSRNTRWEWLASSELKFEINHYDPQKLNLFTALMSNVLLLRLPTSTLTDHDLLYLYFSKNIKSFGLVAEEESALSKQTRTAIGSLLSNILLAIWEDEKERLNSQQHFTQLMAGVSAEIEILKRQHATILHETHERIYSYCLYLARQISEEKAIQISFHESAKEKLKGYHGAIDQLSVIIANAVFFAENSSLNIYNQLIIRDFHLQFSCQEENQADSEIILNHYLSQATQYLDRLESAATLIHSSGRKITGETLGKVMNPPVSPSAISQWITKYHLQIAQLLTNYPDKWQIIRYHFQPLRKKIVIQLQENKHFSKKTD